MATKTPRARRTKAEIEQEFAQIAEVAVQGKSTSSAKLEMAAKLQEAEIRTAVSEVTVEIISQKLSDLNVEISRTLSNLSEKMMGEANLLRSLKEATMLESRELQRLHNIDVTATSIDQLVADYTEKKKAFEVEMSQLRATWEKEQGERKCLEEEQVEASRKARIREQDDYEYKKALERKKVQDCFDEECRLKEKERRERQEALEKNWKEREQILKSREDEFAVLKKEAEQFPSRLTSECTKAAKESVREMETRYNQEIAQLKRDLLVEKQMGDLRIKQLQELLANQQTQMASLHVQLEEAKRQVQDIAVKAIEGASGAKALSHINQIAIEQAKNRTQG